MSKGGGDDLFDMAKDGTTVPEDAAAKPRFIPSVRASTRSDCFGARSKLIWRVQPS